MWLLSVLTTAVGWSRKTGRVYVHCLFYRVGLGSIADSERYKGDLLKYYDAWLGQSTLVDDASVLLFRVVSQVVTRVNFRSTSLP